MRDIPRQPGRRTFLQRSGVAAGAALLPWSVSTGARASSGSGAGTSLSPIALTGSENLVMLAVSRLGYGPRPGDHDQVRAMGALAWWRQQLNPGDIYDGVAANYLAAIPALSQSNAELLQRYNDTTLRPQLSRELLDATLRRAIFSRRQVLEVMTEFWSDHFNINIRQGYCLPFKFSFERELRAHALGRFRDLLGVSAHAPAMMYYLDNYNNLAKSPNENYARELLELHTLGVDGGYSEGDIKEVARCLTGWGFNRTSGEFAFNASVHDKNAKTVLGVSIAPAGVEEGERVLDLVAGHPSTARFIAFKLCRRFISDAPSSSVVEQVAAAFSASGGDIAATMNTLVGTPEFQASYGLKMRRPWEYVVAAARALEIDWTSPDKLGNWLDNMGQYPFTWVPPNGFPDTAAGWADAGSMLARWNFAVSLAGNGLTGVQVDVFRLIGGARTAESIAARLDQIILGGILSADARQTLAGIIANGKPVSQTLADDAIRKMLPNAVSAILVNPLFQVR